MNIDKTALAVSLFDKLADLYQQKFMNQDLYQDSFGLFCDLLKVKGAAVLDVACGPGNISKCLLNRRPDLQLLGIDLAPNMVKLAEINNPSAKFEVMDGRNISSLHSTFDGIMIGFCLPYLSKEEAIKMISDAAVLLNAGGVIYISTMEDDYDKSGFKKGSTGDEIFMHYHEGAYLIKALEENNFTILHTIRQPYPGEGDAAATDLILIAVKKI